MSVIRGWLAVLLFFAVCLSPSLKAQGPGASVTGEVRDPSGAVIVGATITVRNMATNVSRSTASDSAGVYFISALQVGTYEIVADAPGFKRAVQSGATLQVGQDARVDFTMELGATTDVVNVEAAANVTATETASTGQVIDNKKVVELPLNGRQFRDLALLTPAAYVSAQGSALSFRGGFNVAGANETNNNFTINGIDNNDSATAGPSFQPSVEAIQEFRLLTGIFPAEYGRSSGSAVVVVTKSGSNEFHGDLFEFVRNQIFDARNIFTLGTKPYFKRNQFGGTVGGPIRRNRTFFFYSYEGLRVRNQQVSQATVPLSAMKNGDFSSLLTLAKPIQLVDPLTGVAIPGNILPQISAMGKAIASFYPDPTRPTSGGQLPSNNYSFNGPATEDMNQNSLRLDHMFSTKDSLFGNYNRYNDPQFQPTNSLCGSAVLPGFGCNTGLTAQLGAIVETHLFSPTLMNELRTGVNRLSNPRTQEDVHASIPPLQGVFINPLPDNHGVPSTNVTGYSRVGGATNTPELRADNTYQVIESLAWTRGKHLFKIGGEWRKYLASTLETNLGRGSLTFNGTAPGVTSGYPLADLLLGYATSSSRNPYAPKFYDRLSGWAWFVQDDYKVTPYLTLNIGLRWEYFSPISEKYGQTSSFDPTVPGGGLRIENRNGVGNTLYNPDYNNFGPRFGFAWQPFHASSTVVRGGYGVFYNQATTLNGFYNLHLNAPFRSPQTFNSQKGFAVVQIDTDPFPAVLGPTCPGSTACTASGIDPNFPTGYSQQWSLGIQRQIKHILVDLTYFGSKGTHLPSQLNPNQPFPGTGNAGRPFQNFGNISYFEQMGRANYNSLQAKLEKRLSQGFSFLLSYTYGKSIDLGQGTAVFAAASTALPQNSRNVNAERGLSDFDVRHRLVWSPIWTLPFGGSGNSLQDRIVRGWQLAGIFTAQTGRPVEALLSGNFSGTLQNNDRPNAVAGCNPNDGPKTVQQWFNTACFALPPSNTFGNAGRNTIIGPGLIDVDIALSRVFAIGERSRFQFRAEVFNVANHPNFNQPITTVNVPSTYGTIPSALDPREFQFAAKFVF